MTAHSMKLSNGFGLAVDRYIIRPTPGRYGFTIRDTNNGEWELVVMLSGGQDGATRIAAILTQCDGGMYIAKTITGDGNVGPVQKDTYFLVAQLEKEARWPQYPEVRTVYNDAIDAGVKMVMEGMWGTPDREGV